MNVDSGRHRRQVPVFLILLLFASCRAKNADMIIPPATSPLSRQVIAYGVINVSYTQLMEEPSGGSASRSYLRRGDVVSILERRINNTGTTAEKWVLAEGNTQGWLREELMDMYDNELQARTASESMPK